MTSRVAAALLFALLWTSRHYEFPRDYFNHPEYRTEWWYYTGNLQAADGHRFGFELTFFRQGIPLSKAVNPTWRPDEIYLAHLALSDLDGQHFYYTERLNRAGPGLAGVSVREQRIWNGNWQVQWESGTQELTAVCDRFALQLRLVPRKPIVDERQAVHYLSFTRIGASGEVKLHGRSHRVSGLAWMDHEFFNEQEYWRAGWDWFSIQLDSGEELMFYNWRTKPGDSSGTYVNREGKVQYLDSTSFHLAPVDWWQSSRSGARYPIGWDISVPSLGLQLSERTALKDQELIGASGISPTYWEGAVTYTGQIHSQPVHGVGYLEMTGYAPKP
jgi:predicted secreted hydrolase